MVLSPLLIDTYRRYKQGTEKFMQWLAGTARATGTVNDLFDKRAGGTTGRRKGKNRSKQSNIYEIPVNNFTRLAKAIAASTHARAPNLILSILRDVIHERKGCAAWYKAHQDEEKDETKAHNEGHAHFISVLEEVQNILLPLKAEEDNLKNTKKPAERYATEPLANIFENLEIEHCDDWDSTIGLFPSEPKRRPNDSYKMEASDEDISFALYCFLKDLAEIRIFVRRTWKEFKQGHTTLTTAAVTMNTAIDVFRRLNETFLEMFPQFSDHEDIIAYLYDSYCDPNCKTTIEDGNDDFGTCEADGVRLSSRTFFCDHTLMLLKSFFYHGDFLLFIKKSEAEYGITEDETASLRCLSLLSLLDHAVESRSYEAKHKHLMGLDQLYHAIRVMRRENKFPTWTILATQLFVDTRRELKTDTSRGLQELQRDASWIIEAFEDCLEFGKTNNVNSWFHVHSELVRSHIQNLRRIAFDDCVQVIINEFVDKEYSAKLSWGGFFLLKNHPMLCGLFLQGFLVEFQRTGTHLASGQGLVSCAMHLCHAAHLTGLLPPDMKWSDLDYVIEKHGDPWIFVGERPQTLSKCFVHLNLSLGIRPSALAQDRILRSNSKASPRQKSLTKASQTRDLKNISRYVQLSERLDRRTFLLSRASEEPGTMLEMLVNKYIDAEDLNCPANSYGERKKEKKKGNRLLTPIQSITVFKAALKADDFPLRFNMMDLNQRCIELFRRIQKTCIEQSPIDYPPEKYGSDRGLNSVLSRMFAGHAFKGRTQPTRFVEACQLLAEVIASEGNVEYLNSEARVGMVSGTAMASQEDAMEFDGPIQDHLPVGLRGGSGVYKIQEPKKRDATWERIDC